jgi:hypothetical protein
VSDAEQVARTRVCERGSDAARPGEHRLGSWKKGELCSATIRGRPA